MAHSFRGPQAGCFDGSARHTGRSPPGHSDVARGDSPFYNKRLFDMGLRAGPLCAESGRRELPAGIASFV